MFVSEPVISVCLRSGESVPIATGETILPAMSHLCVGTATFTIDSPSPFSESTRNLAALGRLVLISAYILMCCINVIVQRANGPQASDYEVHCSRF